MEPPEVVKQTFGSQRLNLINVRKGLKLSRKQFSPSVSAQDRDQYDQSMSILILQTKEPLNCIEALNSRSQDDFPQLFLVHSKYYPTK